MLGEPRLLESFKDATSQVCEVKWNSLGSYLALGQTSKSVKVATLASSGEALRLVHNISLQEVPMSICWNPVDPNQFAIVGFHKEIEIWDVRASRATSKIASLGNNLFADWSHDGRFIATVNSNDTLAVFDTAAAKLFKKVSFRYEINELAFTANSDHILIATGPVGATSDMGNIDVIGFQNGELSYLESLPAHTSSCQPLRIDPQFRKLAVGSGDYLVSVWDLEEMVCDAVVSDIETVVRSISFNGDGSLMAISGESSDLFIASAASGEMLSVLDCRLPIERCSWNRVHSSLIAVGGGVKSRSDAGRSDNLRLVSVGAQSS